MSETTEIQLRAQFEQELIVFPGRELDSRINESGERHSEYLQRHARMTISEFGGLTHVKQYLGGHTCLPVLRYLIRNRVDNACVERVVLRPKYARLFTAEELQTARTNLSELGLLQTGS